MLFRTGFVGRQVVGGAAGGAPPTLALNFMQPGVLPDPRVVFTRAVGPATYFDSTGTMQNASANNIRNNTMVGAVPGVPGTLPTNWTVATTPGLAWSVIGTGVESGIPYIDMRLSGTTTGVNPSFVHFDASGFPAAVGQTWAFSFYVSLVGGSLTNTQTLSPLIFQQPSGNQRATSLIVPTNAPLNTQRVLSVWTLEVAGTTTTTGSFKINVVGSGLPVDVTFRIGAPQYEQNPVVTPFIPTYGVANGAPRWDYDPRTLQLRGMLMETSRSNVIPNTTMVGAAAGSPGTDPTGWIVSTVGGLTKTIVGVGVESGITYIDYRFNAASSTGGNLNFVMMPGGLSGAPASASSVYTSSVFLSFVGGSFSGISGLTLRVNQSDSGGGGLAALSSSILPVSLFAIGDPLTKSRLNFSATTTATTAFLQAFLQIPIAAGPVDFTIRIGAPQLELGTMTSFIPTSGVAATRAFDNCTLTDAATFGSATTACTLAADFIVPYATLGPGVGNAAAQVDDGSNSNLYSLRCSGTSLSGIVFASNALVSSGTPLSYTPSIVLKAIAAFDGVARTGSMALNGGTVAPFTFSATPAAFSRMQIGQGRTTQIDGALQRVRYWNSVLPSAQLQQATT